MNGLGDSDDVYLEGEASRFRWLRARAITDIASATSRPVAQRLAPLPADPIENALRNFPAESSTQEGFVAVHRTTPPHRIGCRGEGSIYDPAWRKSTDRLRPSPTALRALGEDTSAAVDERNVPVRIVEEVRRSRTGRQGHKSPKR